MLVGVNVFPCSNPLFKIIHHPKHSALCNIPFQTFFLDKSAKCTEKWKRTCNISPPVALVHHLQKVFNSPKLDYITFCTTLGGFCGYGSLCAIALCGMIEDMRSSISSIHVHI